MNGTIKNYPQRGGHAAGHVRDTFLSAVEAFSGWKPGEPEPNVEYEMGYETNFIPTSRACTLVWNCTDCVPGGVFNKLKELGAKNRTYAACARAMYSWIRSVAGGDDETLAYWSER